MYPFHFPPLHFPFPRAKILLQKGGHSMGNKKALIAMSGGVDSSVAAYLMQQAGFDCVGGTMLLTDCIPGADCHAEENIRRASAVAKRLGIPFHVFSFSREFRQYVMEPFVSCYESGGTHTPCVE